jgi:diphosphomevalonate decarboxylase
MALKSVIESFVNKCMPSRDQGEGEANANIALIKYWGKRDVLLNLPAQSSFSITIPGFGTKTSVKAAENEIYHLDGQMVGQEKPFAKRLKSFLDAFRPYEDFCFEVSTFSKVPVASGLASSASGFATLVLALDDFFGWRLSLEHLSILARLGSGSACRSLWQGFVTWNKGELSDGRDSHGIPFEATWPGLTLGILNLSSTAKAISSREAMKKTCETSPLYRAWVQYAEDQVEVIKWAVLEQDFNAFGQILEQNAMTMFATMISAYPSIIYWNAETLEAIKQIQDLRKKGLPVYYTEDAGPHLKLFFLRQDQEDVFKAFPNLQIYPLFETN